MLLSSSTIKPTLPQLPKGKGKHNRHEKLNPVSMLDMDPKPNTFISDREIALTKAIGQIEPGKNTHYYSFGNFNLVRLIVYLLKQLGPSHVFISSYSFSTKSIHQLNHLLDKKLILSFRVLLDNRVRSISPKPFQMIAASFNYRCTSVHAKTALIYNDQWQISVITSQNATDNPKMERGIIFTDPDIFQFDLKNLTDAFNRGTT
jgi:hypothetical protein